MKPEFIIVSGNANRDLATAVAQLLDTEIGKCRVERFPDTEVNVRLDEPVRERRVFIIQSSCPPVDEHAMEVFAIADACRRAAASVITWIAPYFGYGRSDKRRGRRTAVMGRVMADFAEHAGIDHVIAVDLHSPQVEGFFQVPVENLTAVFALAEALKPHLQSGSVIVSPDTGGVKLASAYSSRLGCPVAVLHKERLNGTETVVSRVGGEVRARPCVIVDDMISTGGTIKSAIKGLIQAGSQEHFIVAATHPVFTPEAQKNLKSIRQIIVTNSVPFSADDWPNVQTVSLAPLLAAAIRRSTAGESMANLFQGVIHGGE
ncbi:MAG TPA: ribose-phosphate pyrophosphokinase [Chthoniobacterales bacterium]